MKGQYIDEHGRVHSVFEYGEQYASGVFDRCHGYTRLPEDDAPLRATREEAQEDLDYYAFEHDLRMTDVYAIRYSMHEGPKIETLKLLDTVSGVRSTFAFSQHVEPGVVYLSNRIPGAVDVPGIGCVGDTFYLVGEGEERGDYRDLSLIAQNRWMEILINVDESKGRREMA